MQSVLGEISRQQFLTEYWQKQPLLVRSAIPGFKSPLSPDELAGLAVEPEIESRIVRAPQWTLEQGPFCAQYFSTLPEREWTLLVQGVDLWVPEVAQIMQYFDFLPSWRRDDIMVSYAADGGSVGPHFDYYDVFLIQGMGQRRWKVGQRCDQSSPCLNDTPLRILSQFETVDEWLLSPGDMLYLPPGIAHHGIGEGDNCMTYSVGFRSPNLGEMLSDLSSEIISGDKGHIHLSDPLLTDTHPGDSIPDAYIEQVRQLLISTLDDPQLLGDWLARYMTEPKYPDLVEHSGECRTATVGEHHYRNGLPVD